MPTVNIYDAKTQLSKLVDLASSGTDVVIARAGKPVAKLTALDGTQVKKDRRMVGFGALEGKGWIADDFDAPLPPEVQALFEQSLDEKLAGRKAISPNQPGEEPTGGTPHSEE